MAIAPYELIECLGRMDEKARDDLSRIIAPAMRRAIDELVGRDDQARRQQIARSFEETYGGGPAGPGPIAPGSGEHLVHHEYPPSPPSRPRPPAIRAVLGDLFLPLSARERFADLEAQGVRVGRELAAAPGLVPAWVPATWSVARAPQNDRLDCLAYEYRIADAHGTTVAHVRHGRGGQCPGGEHVIVPPEPPGSC